MAVALHADRLSASYTYRTQQSTVLVTAVLPVSLDSLLCSLHLSTSLAQTTVNSNLVHLVHPALSSYGAVGSWELFPACPEASKTISITSFSHGIVPYLANQLPNL